MVPTIGLVRRSLRYNISDLPQNLPQNYENKYRKIPPKHRWRTYFFGFGIFFFVYWNVTFERTTVVERSSVIKNEDGTPSTLISVVILTYKNPELLSKLLSSVISQKQDYFEVILADAGCLERTQDVINEYFPPNSERKKRMKYLPQCHNPGYAIANNEAAKLAAESSQWILLLNDDLELQGNFFIDDMLKLGNSKPNLGVVGCKLMNGSGDEIDEAGSIIWNDAGAAGFGRGRKDLNASEFMYPRPVDYISGACIMVKRIIFDDYGGFDSEKFPNYYEDTDLQMHVQHELQKEIWLQPRAIANHHAHASFGSEKGVELMVENSKIFRQKWDIYLREKHLSKNPWFIEDQQKEIQILKASDLRARDPSKANILYIDLDIPKNTETKQANRSYETLYLLSGLGHRITVVSYHDTTDEICDLKCRDDIQKHGIEVAMGSWYELAEKRAGFYDTVIINQPLTFLLSYKELATLYQKAPFVLIYYFDTLQHPVYGSNDSLSQSEEEFIMENQSEIEYKLGATADIVVTSSLEDKKRVSTYNSNATIYGMEFIQTNHDNSIIESEWSKVIMLAKDTRDRWYREFNECQESKRKKKKKNKKIFWGWKNPAVPVEEDNANPINYNNMDCKFHDHMLSQTELADTIPKERCAKLSKEYNSRLPTDVRHVEDNAYFLLCSP